MLTQGPMGSAARSLRDISEFNSTLDFTIVFAIDAMRALIKFYNPADEAEHNAWYRKEIAPIKIPKIDVKFADEK